MAKPNLSKGGRTGARPSVPVPPLVVEKIIVALVHHNAGIALLGLARAMKVARADAPPMLHAWLEENGHTWDTL